MFSNQSGSLKCCQQIGSGHQWETDGIWGPGFGNNEMVNTLLEINIMSYGPSQSTLSTLCVTMTLLIAY